MSAVSYAFLPDNLKNAIPSCSLLYHFTHPYIIVQSVMLAETVACLPLVQQVQD